MGQQRHDIDVVSTYTHTHRYYITAAKERYYINHINIQHVIPFHHLFFSPFFANSKVILDVRRCSVTYLLGTVEKGVVFL